MKPTVLNEFVEATWGPQKFAPIEFCSFDVGPFTVRLVPNKGESRLDTLKRAYATAEQMGKEAFDNGLADYLDRVEKAGKLTIARAKRRAK